MQNRNAEIAVILAALNEESGIGPTITELQNVLANPHLIVVDGRSTDKTIEVARNLGADIAVQNGLGKGDAMSHGLRQLDPDSRYVVFTDADFTYPAEFIPKMVEVLEHSPDVGMVIGDRFNGSHNSDRSSRTVFYIGNRILAEVQYILNGVKLNDPLSGLRVVKREILENWRPKSKGFDVEAELNAMVGRGGYKIVEIPINYRSRLGEKKLGLRHGFEIFKRMLVLGLEE